MNDRLINQSHSLRYRLCLKLEWTNYCAGFNSPQAARIRRLLAAANRRHERRSAAYWAEAMASTPVGRKDN